MGREEAPKTKPVFQEPRTEYDANNPDLGDVALIRWDFANGYIGKPKL